MKRYYIIIVSVFCVSTLFSQLNVPFSHTISFTAGGGLSTLNMNVEDGNNKFRLGGLIGIEYTLSKRSWGINTGVHYSMYNSQIELNSFSETTEVPDIPYNYSYTVTIKDYVERQNVHYLNIPLLFQYHFTENMYFAAGGKLGIPLNAKSKIKSIAYEHSVSIPELNYSDILRQKQLNNFAKVTLPKTGLAYFASLELGRKWNVSGRVLHTGIYVDYGLNNILKNKQSDYFIQYELNDREPDFITNPILQSNHYSKDKRFVDKINPLAAGIKITIPLFVFTPNICRCNYY